MEQALGSSESTPEQLVREMEERVIERLERAERSARRLGWMTGALLLMLLFTIAAAALTLPQWAARGIATVAVERMTAREFVLAAPDGSSRGSWGLNEDGSARLMLHDGSGTARLKLTVLRGSGAPGVTLADDRGESRVVLGILPEGTSSVVFADRTGKTRAVLGVSPDGDPTLVMADRQGITKVGLGVDVTGQANLTLSDSTRRAIYR